MAQPKPRSGTYSLGGLFQLVTICSVMLSLIGLLLRYKLVPMGIVTTSCAAGATVGSFFGFLIGLYHYRRARGISVGIFTGMGFGALVAPLCVQGAAGVSLGSPWTATSLALIAAGMLVLLALAYRQFVVRDPVSKKYDFSQFKESDG